MSCIDAFGHYRPLAEQCATSWTSGGCDCEASLSLLSRNIRINVIPWLFGVFINHHLWFKGRGIIHCSCVKEVQLRCLGCFFHHGTSTCSAETAANRISTVCDLVIERNLPFNGGVVDGHSKLGCMTGTRDTLTLPALADECELRLRCS